MSLFEELGLGNALASAFSHPKTIQEEVIPAILSYRDISYHSSTGSGKTAAFTLPISQLVAETVEMASSFVVEESGSYPHSDFFESEILQLCGGASWTGVRAKHGFYMNSSLKGEVSFSVNIVEMDEGSILRVGFSGICDELNLKRYGFGGTGMSVIDFNFVKFGCTFGEGDVVSATLDLASRLLVFAVNGREFDAIEVKNYQCLYPHISHKGCATVTANVTVDANIVHDAGLYGAIDGLQHITNSNRRPTCLTVLPTKELASQVANVYRQHAELASDQLTVTDTASRNRNPFCDILVGTLGSLLSLDKNVYTDVKHVVIDEADSFVDDIDGLKRLLNMLNFAHTIQYILCSATLFGNEHLDALKNQLLTTPVEIVLEGDDDVPPLEVFMVRVPPGEQNGEWNQCVLEDKTINMEKSTDGIYSIARRKNELTNELVTSQSSIYEKYRMTVELVNRLKFNSAIIFVRTRLDAMNLSKLFKLASGSDFFTFEHEVLQGGKRTNERRDALNKFRNGETRILIATDVAARGLDVSNVEVVFSLTMPDKMLQFIHRMGRTGRNGCCGIVISLISEVPLRVWYHTCKNKGYDGKCERIHDVSNKGCCIWYDEIKKVEEISAKLKQLDIKTVSSDQLREKIEEINSKMRTVYGFEKTEVVEEDVVDPSHRIAREVLQKKYLNAQNLFFQLQQLTS
ncbi:hypothetical protein PCE1_001061 [Barthelona sp. PCE]